MTDKEQIIINGCNVSNCKYYMENNGVEYQGLYQYTNMCYKQPYDNCENKPFCWHKLFTRIKRIFKHDNKQNFEKDINVLTKAKLIEQLISKTQECEELKRKVELMMDCPDCKVDEYKKALEEIKKVCIKDTREFADGTTVRYDALDDILDIINKTKGK